MKLARKIRLTAIVALLALVGHAAAAPGNAQSKKPKGDPKRPGGALAEVTLQEVEAINKKIDSFERNGIFPRGSQFKDERLERLQLENSKAILGGERYPVPDGTQLDEEGRVILEPRPWRDLPWFFSQNYDADPSLPSTITTYTGSFDTRLGTPVFHGDLNQPATRSEAYFIVQMLGADKYRIAEIIREVRREAIVEVVERLTSNSFVVFGHQGDVEALKRFREVNFVTHYGAGYKIHPSIGTRPLPGRLSFDSTFRLEIQLFPNANVVGFVEGIRSVGAKVRHAEAEGPVRFALVDVPHTAIIALARIEGVRAIFELEPVFLRLDSTPHVMQTATFGNPGGLNSRVYNLEGLTGTNQRVAVFDDGLDLDSGSFSNTSAASGTAGAAHRKVYSYTPYGGGDTTTCSGSLPSHGTFTTGLIGANPSGTGCYSTDADADGWPDATATAPDAKIVFQDVASASDCAGGTLSTPADLTTALNDARAAGAFLHNNSWGGGTVQAYGSHSSQLDNVMWTTQDLLAMVSSGNAGPAATMDSPGTAKNDISVGGTLAWPSINTVWASSSRGPESSSRIGPQLVAPACDSGTTSGNARRFMFLVGNADTDRNTDPVTCTAASFTTVCGTSFSTPAVVGAATLARQYFTDGFFPSGAANAPDAIVPSGALIKAAMLSSADFVTGGTAGANRWNNNQGYGRPVLSNTFPLQGVSGAAQGLVIRDFGMTTPPAFPYSFTFNAQNNGQPLRIMLAWFDPPASALQNDLDLRVTSPGGTIFYGNNFTGAWSNTGTVDDNTNTTEGVFISGPAVENGVYTVQILGSVVTNHPTYGSQPFAVVAAGAALSPSSFVTLSKEVFTCGGSLSATVTDPTNPTTSYVAANHAITTSNGDSETIAGWTQSGSRYSSGALPIVVGTAVAGDGLLQIAEGATIAISYTDGSANSSQDSATIDCTLSALDAGYLWSGGCDNDQYMDAGENFILTVGIFNDTGVDLTDAVASISLKDAVSGLDSPHFTIVDSTIEMGIMPTGTTSGVAFNILVSSSIPQFYRMNAVISVTSPGDGYTTASSYTMDGNYRGSNPSFGMGDLESFYCNVDESVTTLRGAANDGAMTGWTVFTPFDNFNCTLDAADGVGWAFTTATPCGQEDGGIWHTGAVAKACGGPVQDGTGCSKALCGAGGCNFTDFSAIINSQGVQSPAYAPTYAMPATGGKWSVPYRFNYYADWIAAANYAGVYDIGAYYNPRANDIDYDFTSCATWTTLVYSFQDPWYIGSPIAFGSSDGDFVDATDLDASGDGDCNDPEDWICWDGNFFQHNLDGEWESSDYALEAALGEPATTHRAAIWYQNCSSGNFDCQSGCGADSGEGYSFDRTTVQFQERVFVGDTNCASQVGQVTFDSYAFSACENGSVAITLVDTNSVGAGTRSVSVYSGREVSPGETVVLSETPASSGFFRGTTYINNLTNSSGVVHVYNSDSLFVTYNDAAPVGTSEDHAWVTCDWSCLDFEVVSANIANVGPGDGDGFADAGETVTLTVRLKNNDATTTAQGVQVKASTNSPHIGCFLDDSASFGDIAAGTSVTALDTISFRVNDNATSGSFPIDQLVAEIFYDATGGNFSSTCANLSSMLELSRNFVAYSGEDFEGTDPVPAEGWSHGNVVGDDATCTLPADNWRWTTRYANGTNAYGLVDPTGVSYNLQQSSALYSPSLKLQAGANTLTFSQIVQLETRTGGCWDGGIIQVSVNGGSWTKITNQNTAYNGNLDGRYCQQLGAEPAWCTVGTVSPEAFVTTTSDLGAYATTGDTIKIRWWLGADVSGGDISSPDDLDGWYVDDFGVSNSQVSVAQTSGLPYGSTACSCTGASAPNFAGILTAADADACTDAGVAITWNAAVAWNGGSCGGTGTYRVKRNGSVIASGLTGTSYTDTTGTNGIVYSYVVEAVNAAGLDAGGNAAESAADFFQSCSSPGPNLAPVCEGTGVHCTSGNPMMLTKDANFGSNATINVSFDVSTCSATKLVIYSGSLASSAGYSGCAQASGGASGNTTIDSTAMADVWFNGVWSSGTTSGHPGWSSTGQRTWSGIGFCGTTADDVSDSVCD